MVSDVSASRMRSDTGSCSLLPMRRASARVRRCICTERQGRRECNGAHRKDGLRAQSVGAAVLSSALLVSHVDSLYSRTAIAKLATIKEWWYEPDCGGHGRRIRLGTVHQPETCR